MNNSEAKFILNAYRPGGRDAADATFGPALAQARSDPALGAWFAREQAHGAAVAAKLRAVAPPAGLRDAILMGVRMSDATRRTTRAWWRRPAVWAAAAGVAIMLGVGVAMWPQPAGAAMEPFASFALDDMVHGKHGGHGEKAGELVALLSKPATRLGGDLPVDVAALRATGCRTLRHEGKDVIEVCFARDGAEYHLYVIRHEDLPGLPTRAAPAIIARASGAAAVWSDSRNHYALVSDAGEQALKRLL